MRVKRRINHTGRKRITREMVKIRLQEPSGNEPPGFSAELNLDKLNLPGDADVYLEAYYKDSVQRFEFGTVAEQELSGANAIDEVDQGGRILFRVKVVDNAGHVGRLLASADQIAPEDQGEDPNREHLITVIKRDMGQVPWDLDLSPDGFIKPALKLNIRIPDAINQIRTNPTFQSLVLPAVVREVYGFIFWDCENAVDADSWQQSWLDLGQRISGHEPPESEDSAEVREWIDMVLTGFSNQHALNDRLVFEMTGDAS